jgi:hypothetical protein
MSKETNGVASTTGFAEASSRTGRRGKAPGEVLPAALRIRGETFSAIRHIVEPKLQANATADQLERGPIPTAWEAHLFATKKRKKSLQEKSRRHRGDELGFESPAPPPYLSSAPPLAGDPAPPPPSSSPTALLSAGRRPPRPSSSPQHFLSRSTSVLTGRRPHQPSSPAVLTGRPPHRPSSSAAVLPDRPPPHRPSSSPARKKR